MSHCLGCTEEDAEVQKAVDDTWEYFNAQDKRAIPCLDIAHMPVGAHCDEEVEGLSCGHGAMVEWVEWAGKTLMPRLHVQMAMEKVDMVRAEREQLEEM
jgi:hypothetical protein